MQFLQALWGLEPVMDGVTASDLKEGPHRKQKEGSGHHCYFDVSLNVNGNRREEPNTHANQKALKTTEDELSCRKPTLGFWFPSLDLATRD